MAISTVNVTVPVSGDGPLVSIANLIGDKTVELSGTFQGRYVLLGSQNDVDFVPVAIFDASGDESIKQSLPMALKSVKVRSAARNPVSVTMNVSGILAPGENHFVALATLAAGASGLQPVIDLGTLFPPSGLEKDLAALCSGQFSGLVAVEGSMDGVNFNAIGGFRSDPQPVALLGSQPRLEFSPLLTTDLVRYIRINVEGRITGTTVITYGGSLPVAAVAAPKLLCISDDEAKAVIGNTEVILYEYVQDLTVLPPAGLITVEINGIVDCSGGPAQSAEFRVYVGATAPGDTTGSTMRATVTTVSAAEESVSAPGVAFANPGGKQIIQVTGVCSDGRSVGNIRGITLNIG
jgi:hypothetical protein